MARAPLQKGVNLSQEEPMEWEETRIEEAMEVDVNQQPQRTRTGEYKIHSVTLMITRIKMPLIRCLK